ncbi:hypothetical protein [Planobispora longispora]|uniref:Secreted protein n=1 Tax=Planobispora longispora TaxID=28887 RepID=A0A8J3RMQ1_9ACTN|nr:hypothetical protein [Planobispora longispora]GIH76449.1 hypothetical protein Plo01_28780 [Planobispora longispora]
MSTIKKPVAERIARLIAGLGVAVAAVAVPATPAQADDIPGKLTAHLTITRTGPGLSNCKLVTLAKVGMTNAQAQYLVGNGAKARIEVWGDDPVYDNRLYKAPDASLSAGSDRNGGGLIILSHPTLNCGKYLDEDDVYEGDEDEIYVKVIFEAPGYSRMTKNTNVVQTSFEL